ncbi:hypothetical protein KP79_PYT19498 [Mizuhopecten yessoensis]|uniref:Uncharacterized protein n=1 Tax=Mizuhopecten yessoensis TaxID=6573 RepID=A0A210PFW2_MIZYE|nr:hypothetical protein KP79_PYT19498 [Mizuhopecten yessoensis]
MRPTCVFAVVLVLVLLTWTSIQGFPVNIDTSAEEHVIHKRQFGGGSDTTICYTCAWNNPGMDGG